jgi:hypothetical protein
VVCHALACWHRGRLGFLIRLPAIQDLHLAAVRQVLVIFSPPAFSKTLTAPQLTFAAAASCCLGCVAAVTRLADSIPTHRLIAIASLPGVPFHVLALLKCRRCGAKATGKVLATYFRGVAEKFEQDNRVVATRCACGLLRGPQQSLTVAHLMGLGKAAGNLTRDRGLPRLRLLAPRVSWLTVMAAGLPRLSGISFLQRLWEALTHPLFQDPHRATTHICSSRQLLSWLRGGRDSSR